DGDWHDLAWPVGCGRPEHRQWRMATMVDRQVLEYGHVEFLVYQRLDHMAGETHVALQRWNRAGTLSLVCNGILGAHSQCKRRIVVEKERRRVVVIEENEHVGLAFREPARH